MASNVSQKLLSKCLVSGKMITGEEIGIRIDQALLQDATGTMVMLELEAMGVDRVTISVAVQYVDHNLLETDFKNADDHLFLQSACARYGLSFSPAGNGVSHPVHMEAFGAPGKTLLGSDSHTCAGGSLGMLAIGAGGIEVAQALIGRPFFLTMPKIMGVRLSGKLPMWVSAKDIILEMLRRHGVSGGVGKIIEYYGPGLKNLTAMDRHVIANMGAELGATASVFPSDSQTKKFLKSQNRDHDFAAISKDAGAKYDENYAIDLSKLEPLIALPSSPGNVVPVREVAGRPVYQVMIGSSANPGLRDFAIPAMMLKNRRINSNVSLDVNPASRQILLNLAKSGCLANLLEAGARIHQTGCNGCIGMGQAPGSGRISLRTVPRNFPGRSGTEGDEIYLCSPETAAASALQGVITDPRTLDMPYPIFKEAKPILVNHKNIISPVSAEKKPSLVLGSNIKPLPLFSSLADIIDGPVLIKVGDNISTDGILPAGANVLPFRSNIPEIAKFAFFPVDKSFYERAIPFQKLGSVVVAGKNYGQGSSREHAAIVPRYLGVQAVIAQSFARIHRENLINFGVLPLIFLKADDYESISQGNRLRLVDIRQALQEDTHELSVLNLATQNYFKVNVKLSGRERKIILAGGIINFLKKPFF